MVFPNKLGEEWKREGKNALQCFYPTGKMEFLLPEEEWIQEKFDEKEISSLLDIAHQLFCIMFPYSSL